MTITPVDAVYLLARTQNDYIPVRPTLASPEGFADGKDADGRQLRWLSCPDCLGGLAGPTFGCETCRGRGEIPDPNPDPMREKATGQQAFYGYDHREKADRARAIDGQIIRLQLLTAQREGRDDPEDWLERCRRLHTAQSRSGDYVLLEHAQDRLGWSDLTGYHVWMRCVVDGLPHAPALRPRLDAIAGWMAGWMLGAIAAQRLGEHLAQTALGVRRPRLRPAEILVPAGLLEAEMPGKGRWANQYTQSQRNAAMVGMRADGKTDGEIARRVGLTKRRVQQLLAQVDVVAATGPAA